MDIELKDLIGIPYKVHGRDKNGYDCYGLVIEVMKRLGKYLPDVFYDSLNQDTTEKIRVITSGLPLKIVESPTKYCIITMKLKGYENHIAVYIGEGKIIHATLEMGVVIEDLKRYQSRIINYNVLGDD